MQTAALQPKNQAFGSAERKSCQGDLVGVGQYSGHFIFVMEIAKEILAFFQWYWYGYWIWGFG